MKSPLKIKVKLFTYPTIVVKTSSTALEKLYEYIVVTNSVLPLSQNLKRGSVGSSNKN